MAVRVELFSEHVILFLEFGLADVFRHVEHDEICRDLGRQLDDRS